MKRSVVLVGALLTLAIFGEAVAQPKSQIADAWKLSATDGSSSFDAEYNQKCADGLAGPFPCRSVDLMAYLPLDSLGGERHDGKMLTSLNDIWGWTDPQTSREYALVGRSDGTAFVDVTEPTQPVYLGQLPMTAGSRSSAWRDVKVYADHAFIVADNAGAHGMQVFDLTQLRNVENAPETFEESARYDEIFSAHNIVINPESGFAYAVGSGGGGTSCAGGLHMIDIQDPLNPTFAGCHAVVGTGYARSGYTHDAQCVIYHGPDEEYAGREICLQANETHIVVSDVTDKSSPTTISTVQYPAVSYAHQGWLTEDHAHFFQDDEADERCGGFGGCLENTRTIIWDLEELDDPQLDGIYVAETRSIDHNQYVRGNRVFQSNYTSGLRILDISTTAEPVEIAYFDGYPAHDGTGFIGSWSNYPYFESGIVVFTGINEGLFIVRPTGAALIADPPAEVPGDLSLGAAFPNPFRSKATVELMVDRPQRVRVALFDTQGKEVAELYAGFVGTPGRLELEFDGEDLASGVYFIRATGVSGTRTRAVTLQR